MNRERRSHHLVNAVCYIHENPSAGVYLRITLEENNGKGDNLPIVSGEATTSLERRSEARRLS